MEQSEYNYVSGSPVEEEEKYRVAVIIQKNIRSFLSRKRTVIKILETIDWSKLIDLYNIFGESLNSNDMKFMKGKLIEIFVSTSHKCFNHVDEIGYDLTCLGIRVEMKFSQYMILSEKKRELKKNIGFRFKNSNGSNEMKLTLSNTASIYVLVQRDAIAWCDGYDVITNIKKKKGDLDVKIPCEKINLMWKNSTNVEKIDTPELNLSEIINQIYTCVTTSIWKNEDWRIGLKGCLKKISDKL